MAEHEQRGEYHGKTEPKQKIQLPAIIAAVAIVCLLAGYFVAVWTQPKAEATTTPSTGLNTQQLRSTVAKYLNDIISLQGGEGIAVEAVNATLQNGMYAVGFNLKKDGNTLQNSQVFVSPDGKQLFLSMPLDLTKELPEPSPEPVVEMKKSDKPVVEMFVMSFCPYGQQAEAGIGPAVKALGNITFEPHFVIYDKTYCENTVAQGYYKTVEECGADTCFIDNATGGWYCTMHGTGELNEDVRQMCIRKYQPETWWAYVEKINTNSKVNSSTVDALWKGIAQATGINTIKIEKCLNEERLAILQNEQQLDAEKDAQGSPTILVNGAPYEGGRSPENFKTAFCSAYNTPPEACNQTLSSTASAAGGSCG